MSVVRDYCNELRGVVDPRLQRRLDQLFEMVYKLQETPSQPVVQSTLAQAIQQQLQSIGLVNAFGTLLIGIPSTDPQISQLAAQPGTGTVTSISASSSASGFALVAAPAPITGAGSITFSITNAANARVSLEVSKVHSAAAAPVVGNDSTQGYVRGSIWVDTTGPTGYVCLDNAVGAAVWHAIP